MGRGLGVQRARRVLLGYATDRLLKAGAVLDDVEKATDFQDFMDLFVGIAQGELAVAA